MLSAGRGLQLGQTHRGTRTNPWTITFITGKEGWFLFISLFILSSLPQDRAWPYGKRLTRTTACFSLPVSVSVWCSLLVYFLCSQKAGISSLTIPSSSLPVESTKLLSRAHKKETHGKRVMLKPAFTKQQRKHH